MDVKTLYKQMATFADWKQQLAAQLSEFQAWSNEHRIGSGEAKHCLKNALQTLSDNSFTLALVGEFSRGKTEIINALLFADYGQRLLPSRPGRTTMCPTEIFFDPRSFRDSNIDTNNDTNSDTDRNPDQQDCVRLLPIETRRSNVSLDSFKRIPKHWVTLPFDPRNPVDIANAMAQISRVKCVSEADAKALGFDCDTLVRNPNGEVEIPAWRHALVNLDHPLLRHGLRIIDTPGLNALGNEPELTLSNLSQAQAILFLLSADSGVSASDMQLWQDYVDHLRANQNTLVIALLNKIDALWDDLLTPQEVDLNLRNLRELTARQLQLPMEHVVGISAKQGLLAKASQNAPLLKRSKLPQLETQLAQSLIEKQRQLANHSAIRDVLSIMTTTRDNLKKRLFTADKELEQLQQQPNNEEFLTTLEQQRRDVKEQQSKFHRLVLNLRSHQKQLAKQHRQLQTLTHPQRLEELISSTQDAMRRSWTAKGMSQAMDTFFQDLHKKSEKLELQVKQANNVLHDIYQRQPNSGDHDSKQHLLDISEHQMRLRQLKLQAEQFQLSVKPLFNNRKRLSARFLNSLIQESRQLNLALSADIDNWIKQALAPVSHHTQHQKQLLEQHMVQLANLKQEHDANKSRRDRLQQLRAHIARHEDALFSLDGILKDVQVTPPATAISLPRTTATA